MLKQIWVTFCSVPARLRTAFLVLLAVSLASPAYAQDAATAAAAMNFAAWVGAVQTTMVAIINASGPALFGLLALIGGLYFVWNRVRSLW